MRRKMPGTFLGEGQTLLGQTPTVKDMQSSEFSLTPANMGRLGGRAVTNVVRHGPGGVLSVVMEGMARDAVSNFQQMREMQNLDISAGRAASMSDTQAAQERAVGLQQNVWSTADRLAAENPDIAPQIRAAGAQVAMPHGIASKQADDAYREEQRRLLSISTDPAGFDKFRRYQAGEIAGYEILTDPNVSPYWKKQVSEEALQNPNAGRRQNAMPADRDRASFGGLSSETKRGLRDIDKGRNGYARDMLRELKGMDKDDFAGRETIVNSIAEDLAKRGVSLTDEDREILMGGGRRRSPAELRAREQARRQEGSASILRRGVEAGRQGNAASLRTAEDDMILDLRRRGQLPSTATLRGRRAEESARNRFRGIIDSQVVPPSQQPPAAGSAPAGGQGTTRGGAGQQAGSMPSFASIGEAAKSPNLQPGQSVTIGGSPFVTIPGTSSSGAPQYSFIPAMPVGGTMVPDPGEFTSPDDWGAVISDEQRSAMLRAIKSDPSIRSMLPPEMLREIDAIANSRVGFAGQTFSRATDERAARAELRSRENRALHAAFLATGAAGPSGPGGMLSPDRVREQEESQESARGREKEALDNLMKMPPTYRGQQKRGSSGGSLYPEDGEAAAGVGGEIPDPDVLTLWQAMPDEGRQMVSDMFATMNMMPPLAIDDADLEPGADNRVTKQELLRIMRMAQRGASQYSLAVEMDNLRPGFIEEHLGRDSVAMQEFVDVRRELQRELAQAAEAVRSGSDDISSMVPVLTKWHDTLTVGVLLADGTIPAAEKAWFEGLDPEYQTDRVKFAAAIVEGKVQIQPSQQQRTQKPQQAASPAPQAEQQQAAEQKLSPEEQWDERIRAMSEEDLDEYIEATARRTKLTDPGARQAFESFVRDHWANLNGVRTEAPQPPPAETAANMTAVVSDEDGLAEAGVHTGWEQVAAEQQMQVEEISSQPRRRRRGSGLRPAYQQAIEGQREQIEEIRSEAVLAEAQRELDRTEEIRRQAILEAARREPRAPSRP